MDNNTRVHVKFQLLQHEEDDQIVDFSLELTNFPRNNLSDFLAMIRNTFTKPRSTPPDEAT